MKQNKNGRFLESYKKNCFSSQGKTTLFGGNGATNHMF